MTSADGSNQQVIMMLGNNGTPAISRLPITGGSLLHFLKHCGRFRQSSRHFQSQEPMSWRRNPSMSMPNSTTAS